MDIKFYCGVGETSWNTCPVTPGPYTCISPVYGNTHHTRKENRIALPNNTAVIQDSGAFSDGIDNRLSVEVASARQIMHAHKYNYAHQITHVASYDLLIDERWKEGVRYKERWTEDIATTAVQETVDNAKWLSNNRHIIPHAPHLVLSAQGVTPNQYLSCTQQIIPYLQKGDIFGLGGWCITGKRKAKMMPILSKTMQLIFPVLHEANVTWVHVWGVLLAEALAQIGFWCNKYNIIFSTDSVGPSTRPAFGKWGYADWINPTYKRKNGKQRGIDRIHHVQKTREWLSEFKLETYLNPKYASFLK